MGKKVGIYESSLSGIFDSAADVARIIFSQSSAREKLSEKTYRQRFKVPDYELNPIFRKNIARKQWVSIRHLAMVVLVGVFCTYWYFNWLSIDDTYFTDEMLFSGRSSAYL